MTRGARSQVADVSADVSVVDGRVSLDVEHATADVTVTGRDRRPLSAAEPHVTLSVAGDGFRAAVRLDGDQAAALRDALDVALSWEDTDTDGRAATDDESGA